MLISNAKNSQQINATRNLHAFATMDNVILTHL